MFEGLEFDWKLFRRNWQPFWTRKSWKISPEIQIFQNGRHSLLRLFCYNLLYKLITNQWPRVLLRATLILIQNLAYTCSFKAYIYIIYIYIYIYQQGEGKGLWKGEQEQIF